MMLGSTYILQIIIIILHNGPRQTIWWPGWTNSVEHKTLMAGLAVSNKGSQESQYQTFYALECS